jgi:hypothetical protein
MPKKERPEIPSSEEIISSTEVPSELSAVPEFLESWADWCDYKQNEAMDDRSGSYKPWRTLQAAQREMSHIRNQFRINRDVVHVIAESMRNQWIGIRFDLISDRTGNAVMPKTRDQISALDVEWSKLKSPQLN